MILVTGGTGFLGSHLLLHLVRNKKTVVATFRKENRVKNVEKFFCSLDSNGKNIFKKILWRKCDITIIPDLQEVFNGITHVYHCAALISFSNKDIIKLNLVNKIGTQNIVNFSIKNKIKKIAYVSSIATLGNENKDNQIDENSIWENDDYHSPYAFSKHLAELEIWRAIEEGVPSVIINPGIILGKGIIPNPLHSLKKYIEKNIIFYPSGVAHLVLINDVVNGLFKLMESDIVNENFILVSENWSYKDLFFLINSKKYKKNIMIKLNPFFAHLTLFIEFVLSIFFFRKRILNFKLIKSISNSKKINGNKIKKKIDFKYSNLQKIIIEDL
tara:strand:- start:1301 stop:2287 length:987 start_codon:yes stop_codon:yes gene_type:complete